MVTSVRVHDPEFVAQEFINLVAESLPHAAAGMFRDYLERLRAERMDHPLFGSEKAKDLEACIKAVYDTMTVHADHGDEEDADDLQFEFVLMLMKRHIREFMVVFERQTETWKRDLTRLLGEEQMAWILED